ncbi:SAM-dependent methyltransferase [Cytobacillus eiseniae]|uniref:SAM-dependent methyltransferase n=1 Tax=Cytobacillus eiseniae TaxID=762947 RepID=A0ABS4RK62_9BACI|nr:class I SAM-dependent methyltransferase [Cytobacillus eiseniae]MBP2242801.1 SAM-dependent methyltransferase [Cytobacillus eiseniae]
MSFYKTLTPFYDQIFPANTLTEQFLSSHLLKNGNILDVGAGTGNMAITLSKDGFTLTATEPEKKMANEIRSKAVAENLQIKVDTKSMQEIDEFLEPFDGIYCIGNTLAHLNHLDEIQHFFQHTYEKLHEHGKFIFQIVNFEKVLTNKDFHFPIIKKEAFEFQRHYELVGDKILFTTTLIVDGISESNTIPLYPATANQLLPLLEKIGFKKIEAYGNFKGEAYTVNTPALIVVATK